MFELLYSEATMLVEMATELDVYQISPERFGGMVTELVRLAERGEDLGLITVAESNEIGKVLAPLLLEGG